jgi:hypothetical protein
LYRCIRCVGAYTLCLGCAVRWPFSSSRLLSSRPEKSHESTKRAMSPVRNENEHCNKQCATSQPPQTVISLNPISAKKVNHNLPHPPRRYPPPPPFIPFHSHLHAETKEMFCNLPAYRAPGGPGRRGVVTVKGAGETKYVQFSSASFLVRFRSPLPPHCLVSERQPSSRLLGRITADEDKLWCVTM